MKQLLAVMLLCVAARAHAQPAWMPLSREVEAFHLRELMAPGYTHHTALKPYRRDAFTVYQRPDSTYPTAVWQALDRWAGVRNGRKVRWGPLADLSMGGGLDSSFAMLHRAGAGFWMDADLHPKWSLHVDAQGWDQRFAPHLDTLARAIQVAPGEGYAWVAGNGFRHAEVQGHVSWDPGRYFNITAGRGRNFLGDGHRSMVLSDETYAYPFLRITTRVWRVRYVNLFASLSDIRGAGGVQSDFRRKYTSMHYLSWNATKRLNVSLFESIVWNRGDSLYPRGFDINYLNPIIFYRPVEFAVGSPDNAMLGLTASYKVGKGVLVYGQLMLDEFLANEIRQGKGWYGNKQSGQLGVLAHEPFGAAGVVVRGEFNVVRPFMYTHSDVVQNYSHFGQPLAHPYGSNLREAILHVDRRTDRWHFALRGSMAWMGSDTVGSHGNSIFRPESERPRDANGVPINRGYSIGDASRVKLFHAQARLGYLLDPSTATRLEVSYLFRHRDPARGAAYTLHVVQVGVVCHFRQRYVEQDVRYVLQ